MGAEVECVMKHEGRSFKGRALLETHELMFRGERSLKIPFRTMRSLKASKGVLLVDFRDGVASFDLKDKAEVWLNKILNPKSVLEKLGVKEDSRVSVEGVDDKDFLKKLKEKTTGGVSEGFMKDSDLIFYGAKSAKDLARLKKIKSYLKSDGGLWIVSLKGKAATLKEADVMAAGKKAGLVDTKVVGFSDTHTALKFVIPIKQRTVVSK